MGVTGIAGFTRSARRWTAWAGLPRWGQMALAAYVIGFAEGACAHLGDFVSRGFVHTYDRVWWPSQVLYYTLVVWDSLAIWLALRARAAVAPLGVATMALDLTANWYNNWSAIRADPGLFWAPVGLLPMSLFGLVVAVAAVPLWRLLRRRKTGRATAGRLPLPPIERSRSGHYPDPRDTSHT